MHVATAKKKRDDSIFEFPARTAQSSGSISDWPLSSFCELCSAVMHNNVNSLVAVCNFENVNILM